MPERHRTGALTTRALRLQRRLGALTDARQRLRDRVDGEVAIFRRGPLRAAVDGVVVAAGLEHDVIALALTVQRAAGDGERPGAAKLVPRDEFAIRQSTRDSDGQERADGEERANTERPSVGAHEFRFGHFSIVAVEPVPSRVTKAHQYDTRGKTSGAYCGSELLINEQNALP